MNNSIESFPLCWPVGRPRTPGYQRTWSRFDTSLAKARDRALGEIRQLGGKEPIISSNLALRLDGLPSASQRAISDSGVAVYFTYKKRPMCFACDRWAKVEDNMHAISLTIGALRGVARWGTGDMMEAAFSGFTALPAPGQTSRGWREVLCVNGIDGIKPADAETAYKMLRSRNHPDKNPGDDGAAARFHEIQQAYEQACAELGKR